MPIFLLNLYCGELPRIIAERNLLQVDITAVGSGMMKEDAAKNLVEAWHSAANENLDPPPVMQRISDSSLSPNEIGAALEASGWRKTSGPSRRR